MYKKFTFIAVFILFLISALQAQPSERTKTKELPDNPLQSVYPPLYATTNGTSAFTGPLASSARTYQLLINENLLTGLVNKNILSITFRNFSTATTPWPEADVTFSNYDIYLSGSVAPSARSLTFAQNIVGQQILVRSGPLVIPANSFPIGGSPNQFGTPVTFTTPYLYTGGHLLIEIRHAGSTGTSRSVDAVGTAITGYGTDFSACWIGSYTGTTGNQGNFSVIALEADGEIPVELSTFRAKVSGNSIILYWETATETNNAGFEIERRTEETGFEKIGFAEGAGTVTSPGSYSFTDNWLTKGKFLYRLKQTDYDGTFSYSHEIEAEVAEELSYSLSQNYPNPFNPSTGIGYVLAEPGFVRLTVINAAGELVAEPVQEFQTAGAHKVTFDASALPSGIYLYRLKSGNFCMTRKMILVR